MPIVKTIATIVGRDVGWFDYDNEVPEAEQHGYFDTISYVNEVNYVGEMKVIKNEEFTIYDCSFPTSWFYENFEDKLQSELNDFYKKRDEQKKERANKANN